MDDILVYLSLGVLTLMTALSWKDDRLTPMAGFAWTACSIFVFYEYHLLFTFLGTGVGLYLLLTGVMDYYG